MATGRKQTPMKVNDTGLGYLYWFGMLCSASALLCVFIAFASPFWYKSWTRVHSPLANIGLWHVCLSGWVKPYDPQMRAYVGCWWIHSTFFEDVYDLIMPVWFRVVQALVIFTLLCNIASTFFLSLFFFGVFRDKYYDTKKRKMKMFIINAILLFAAGGLVLIVSFVFAMKAKDPNWLARPWLCYFSWSFGFNVMSGFFSAFGGISIFIKATEIRKKPDPGRDDIDKRAGYPLPPVQPRNDVPFYEPSENDSKSIESISGAPSKHSESFV